MKMTHSKESVMDIKKSMSLLYALQRISTSIKVSLDDLEPHLDDPFVEEYAVMLKEVGVEMDSTIYAIEQMQEAIIAA